MQIKIELLSKITNKYKQASDLPLYQATRQILYKLDDIMNILHRDKKHTLGQHMVNISLQMLDCISWAYMFPEQRVSQLSKYLSLYNNLSTILKMCHEKGYLFSKDHNYYIDLIKPLGSACKQARGWYNSLVDGSEKLSEPTEMPGVQ